MLLRRALQKQFSRLLFGLQMFHVKPHEASEAETNTFVSISEPIKVGRRVSKHTQGENCDHTCVDIAEPQYVGLRCNRSSNFFNVASYPHFAKKAVP